MRITLRQHLYMGVKHGDVGVKNGDMGVKHGDMGVKHGVRRKLLHVVCE